MENEIKTRERVHAALLSQPGRSATALGRALSLDASTVSHHLKKLERGRQAVSAPVGREVCWFATRSGLCPVLLRAIPVLRRPQIAAVALALSEDVSQSTTDIARRTGVELGQVRWSGETLRGCGLSARSRGGLLVLTEGARTCVEKAIAGERCGLWGDCSVSKRWEEERATSARSPSGSRASAGRSSDPPRAPSSG
jgi:DNA-binding transcriptional ArsR family regulator